MGKVLAVMPLLLFVFFLFFLLLVVPSFLLLFVLLAAVVLPLWLAVGSLYWIAVSPSSYLPLIRSVKARRNHALMHAVLSVLEERYGALDAEGVPSDQGFTLRGLFDRQEVLHAAREALARVVGGEVRLVSRKRCAPSVMTLAIPMAVAALLLLWWVGGMTALRAALLFAGAFGLACLGAPRLQRWFLSGDLEGMEIVGVEERRIRRKGVVFLSLSLGLGEIFVRTRMSGEPLEAEVLPL